MVLVPVAESAKHSHSRSRSPKGQIMFEIPEVLTEMSGDDLTALAAAARAAIMELAAAELPTVEQLAEAETIASGIERIDAELSARSERTARAAALRSQFAEAPETTAEVPAEAPVEVPAEVVETPAAAPSAQTSTTAAPAPTVAAAAARIERPVVPAAENPTFSLTAAADVPGFSTGTELNGLAELAQAVVARARGFQPPKGDGLTEDIRRFGVATVRRNYPEDLIIDRGSDDMEVLAHAADESRLPGGSLTAAGGWCAPSEVLYSMCEQEVADGILTLPSVQVNRGGIKFTKGPDFSDIFGNADGFFVQTEAEAEAGTAKPCATLTCPTWEEIRLAAIGRCFKVPILTDAAYPELTQRYIRGTVVAYQKKVNAKVIGDVVTALGAAKTYTDMLSTTGSTLASIEFLIEQQRYQYSLPLNATMEAFAPAWLKGAIRADLSMRMGVPFQAVTDAMIQAEFAARGASIQWVRDWQDLTGAETAYPATAQIAVYQAGAFVRGVSDVISLGTIYDAASLAVNTYTGMFFEEGYLIANMCGHGALLQIAVCNSGKTGAANIDLCPAV